MGWLQSIIDLVRAWLGLKTASANATVAEEGAASRGLEAAQKAVDARAMVEAESAAQVRQPDANMRQD